MVLAGFVLLLIIQAATAGPVLPLSNSLTEQDILKFAPNNDFTSFGLPVNTKIIEDVPSKTNVPATKNIETTTPKFNQEFGTKNHLSYSSAKFPINIAGRVNPTSVINTKPTKDNTNQNFNPNIPTSQISPFTQKNSVNIESNLVDLNIIPKSYQDCCIKNSIPRYQFTESKVPVDSTAVATNSLTVGRINPKSDINIKSTTDNPNQNFDLNIPTKQILSIPQKNLVHLEEHNIINTNLIPKLYQESCTKNVIPRCCSTESKMPLESMAAPSNFMQETNMSTDDNPIQILNSNILTQQISPLPPDDLSNLEENLVNVNYMSNEGIQTAKPVGVTVPSFFIVNEDATSMVPQTPLKIDLPSSIYTVKVNDAQPIFIDCSRFTSPPVKINYEISQPETPNKILYPINNVIFDFGQNICCENPKVNNDQIPYEVYSHNFPHIIPIDNKDLSIISSATFVPEPDIKSNYYENTNFNEKSQPYSTDCCSEPSTSPRFINQVNLSVLEPIIDINSEVSQATSSYMPLSQLPNTYINSQVIPTSFPVLNPSNVQTVYTSSADSFSSRLSSSLNNIVSALTSSLLSNLVDNSASYSKTDSKPIEFAETYAGNNFQESYTSINKQNIVESSNCISNYVPIPSPIDSLASSSFQYKDLSAYLPSSEPEIRIESIYQDILSLPVSCKKNPNPKPYLSSVTINIVPPQPSNDIIVVL